MDRYFGEIGTVMPGRLKVWTTGQDRQDGGRRYLLDHQVQEFKGRGVSPV